MMSRDLGYNFLYLHNSYLLIEGYVLKADDTRCADADLIALTNNGLLHLFSSLHWLDRRWNMSIILVRLHHFLVCRAIHQHIMKDVAQGWYPDTSINVDIINNIGFSAQLKYLVKHPDPKGSFQCATFGCVDEYSKVTYGIRDTLQLIRNDDNDALFRTAVLVLGKLYCLNSRVQPNDVRELNLYKSIASNSVIPVWFRMRKRSLYFKQDLLYGD